MSRISVGLIVYPASDWHKICDKARYVTLEEDIIATDNVGDTNINIVVLSDDWKEGLLRNQDKIIYI